MAMSEHSLSKKAIEIKIKVKRLAEKPTSRWKDQMKRNLKRRGTL